MCIFNNLFIYFRNTLISFFRESSRAWASCLSLLLARDEAVMAFFLIHLTATNECFSVSSASLTSENAPLKFYVIKYILLLLIESYKNLITS